MSRPNTNKPPTPISPIITRIHVQSSTSTTHSVEVTIIVLLTSSSEPAATQPQVIFVSPTRGTLTLEQLRKSTQDTTSKFE